MTRDELLDHLRAHSAISIAKLKDPTIRQQVHAETAFLDAIDAPLRLRIDCLLNNIMTIPLCAKCRINPVTHFDAKFVKYCGPICSRSDKTIAKPDHAKLMDHDWVYDQRITQRKSVETIAAELGCSPQPVRVAIKRHNIPKVRYNEAHPLVRVKLDDKEWLFEQYKTLGKTQDEIADVLGCAKGTVCIALAKHGIEATPANAYDRSFVHTTKPVQEIINTIRQYYTGDIETNNRSTLTGRELDILIPDKHIAIEYNGVYHHLYRPDANTAAQIKGSEYHVGKTDGCESAGIQLIQVFSSVYNVRKPIFNSMLRTKLGCAPTTIQARKCTLVTVDAHKSIEFITANHIQGSDRSSSIRYGLCHQGELVALMTFCLARYNSNFRWELARYASALDSVVVGGFSRLLTHFRHHHSGSIVSYADRMYSQGAVYRKNGFRLLHVNRPGYYYVKRGSETLIHRSRMTKQRLFELGASNPTWSEFEMARELGYDRIYDCGTLAFGLE